MNEWVKRLYRDRPFGNFLVLLIDGGMYVVRDVQESSLILSEIRKLEVQKEKLECSDFRFSNFWYIPETDRIEFGGTCGV